MLAAFLKPGNGDFGLESVTGGGLVKTPYNPSDALLAGFDMAWQFERNSGNGAFLLENAGEHHDFSETKVHHATGG
jgi:hypothetical protein